MTAKKSKSKKFKRMSPLEAIHDTATGLYDAGVLAGTTMREFDELCIPEVHDLSASAIKKLRLREKVSQAVFSKYLNTSVSTIKQWEIGEKHPRGISLRFLNLIEEKGLGILGE